jgi:hypothetical protein
MREGAWVTWLAALRRAWEEITTGGGTLKDIFLSEKVEVWTEKWEVDGRWSGNRIKCWIRSKDEQNPG